MELYGRLRPNTMVAIVSMIESLARWMAGAGRPSNRSREANCARRMVSPLILSHLLVVLCCSGSSVADVLQEPLGWNLAAYTLCLGKLIDAPGERPELVALQVAALREGDLLVGGADATVAFHNIGKGDGALGREHGAVATAALALALEAGLDVGARRIGDVLVVGTVGAPGRGCVAEPHIEIDAVQDRSVLEA